jgi:hypothetical protein
MSSMSKLKRLEICLRTNSVSDLEFYIIYLEDILQEIEYCAKQYDQIVLPGVKQVMELVIRVRWWHVQVKAGKFIEYLNAQYHLYSDDEFNPIFYIRRDFINNLCDTHFCLDKVGIKPTSYRDN